MVYDIGFRRILETGIFWNLANPKAVKLSNIPTRLKKKDEKQTNTMISCPFGYNENRCNTKRESISLEGRVWNQSYRARVFLRWSHETPRVLNNNDNRLAYYSPRYLPRIIYDNIDGEDIFFQQQLRKDDGVFVVFCKPLLNCRVVFLNRGNLVMS